MTVAQPRRTTTAPPPAIRRPAPGQHPEETHPGHADGPRGTHPHPLPGLPGRAPKPGSAQGTGVGGPVPGPASELAPGAKTRTQAAPIPADLTEDLVAEMARRLCHAALEVISGARSVHQLARWLDPQCLEILAARARLHAAACHSAARHHPALPTPGAATRVHHPALMHSTHVCAISAVDYEVAVIVAEGNRFRALALRFEQRHTIWQVTALHIG